jgi:hypothetical protein
MYLPRWIRAKAQRQSDYGLDLHLIAGEAKDYNTSKLVTQGDVIAPKGPIRTAVLLGGGSITVAG